MRWVIIEVFDFGEYRHLDVKNKVVVDVGAAYGDSTIYFLLRGAKKVIAIKPHPEAFKEMIEIDQFFKGLKALVIVWKRFT